MVNTSIWIWGMLISSFSPGCGQVSIGTELRSISLRMFGLFYLSALLFSHSVVSYSLWPLQYARLPCPSPSSGACSNSCPLSQRCLSAWGVHKFRTGVNRYSLTPLFPWVSWPGQLILVLASNIALSVAQKGWTIPIRIVKHTVNRKWL